MQSFREGERGRHLPVFLEPIVNFSIAKARCLTAERKEPTTMNFNGSKLSDSPIRSVTISDGVLIVRHVDIIVVVVVIVIVLI